MGFSLTPFLCPLSFGKLLTNRCAAHNHHTIYRIKSMEKEIKEALNFAIGAAKTLREQADSILLKVEKEFKELSAKGSQDQSEVANNLRKYIEDALRSVEGLAGQVNSKVEEAKKEFGKKNSND